MSATMTRRSAVLGAAPALLAATAGLTLAAGQGQAQGQKDMPDPLVHKFALGKFEVMTLLAGTRTTADPQGTFGTNVSAEDFARVAAENFIPSDKTQNFFVPVLIRTESDLVLFDTGLVPEGVLAALSMAGIAAEDVTVVVLTHMHGDHIGGLSGASGPTFPKARYAAGRIEFDHWSKAGNEGFEKHVKPLADQMTLLDDQAEVVPGITARLAPGHTPGHMVFAIESEGQQLMLIADTANHYVWSLAHPDWEVRFDANKPEAAATRRKVLGEIAEKRIPFIGYHMPFPSVGYIAKDGEGFRYMPVTYQHRLE